MPFAALPLGRERLIDRFALVLLPDVEALLDLSSEARPWGSEREMRSIVVGDPDLSQDRRDWEALPEDLRDEMLWGLSAFFVGEERVTSQFSGLVLAAEDKHEEAFLLTVIENLQRADLSAREEAAALEVLVRERGWSTRQVAEAVHRSAAYVSRRLRVFDDPTLDAEPVQLLDDWCLVLHSSLLQNLLQTS